MSGSTGVREGDVFVLSFYLKGKRVAADLQARVVRAKPLFTGLIFVNPDRRQMDALHTLVLEEQKEQAEERKKIRYRFD